MARRLSAKPKPKAYDDHRLDWRDPAMPVLRLAQDDLTGEITLEPMTPAEATALSHWQLHDDPDAKLVPYYKDDPTYNMAIRTPRKARRFR